MASKAFFQSGPPELVLLVLGCLDSVQDVLAFTLASRHIQRVWSVHGAAVLWDVFLRELPSFDEAIIAVGGIDYMLCRRHNPTARQQSRISKVVADAEERREQPPMNVSPGEFSGRRRAPTLPELQAARTLNQLCRVVAAAWAADKYTLIKPNDRATVASGQPELPENMPDFNGRIHRAIYRSIIAGAALAGTYLEPFYVDKERGGPDMSKLRPRADTAFYREQLDFLENFAVWNRASTAESEDAAFGSVGAWLLDSILSDQESRSMMADRFDKGYGRSEYCAARKRAYGVCPVELVEGGSHSDAHFVVWELMQLLWVVDHVDDVVNYTRGFEDNNNGQYLKTFAVLFKVFTASEIMAPKIMPQEVRRPIKARVDFPTSSNQEGATKPSEGYNTPRLTPSFRISYLLLAVHLEWRPNKVVDQWSEITPMHFKFFDFFLRRYLGLRFCTKFFSFAIRQEDSYQEWTNCLAIFTNDDVEDRVGATSFFDIIGVGVGFLDGSEVLESYNPRPEIHYDEYLRNAH